MATSTIILIVVIAIAVVVLIAAIAWVARNKRNQHRHVAADKIRESVREESLQVGQQEALADETAAKARAAQAEADVKAAQAAGLQQQAAVHRHEASTSRDHLDNEWARADTMDPATQTPASEDRVDTSGPLNESK
jgi:FtsZ-interacting cell division protein ZipA